MPEHQSLSLAEGLAASHLGYDRLWQRYLAIGGLAAPGALKRYVDSDRCPDDHEHNVIAQALNDEFADRGEDHPVAYRHLFELGEPSP